MLAPTSLCADESRPTLCSGQRGLVVSRTPPPSSSETNPETWLLAEARRGDPERALLCALLPRPARLRAAALVLLNAELVRVAEIASEEMVALLRLQWWREAIERTAAGGVPEHPLLHALAHPLHAQPGLARELLALVGTREDFLLTPRFDDVGAFERFVRATSGRLHELLARVDPDAAGGAPDPLFAHLGTAYGVSGLLRALPHYARRGISVLPEDMLPRKTVLAAGRDAAARSRIRAAVAELVAQFATIPGLPQPLAPARALHLRMLRTLALWSRRVLARAAFDPFRLTAGPRPGLAFRLLLAHLGARVRNLR